MVCNEAYPFLKPVNRKTVKNYYEIIKQPMFLETIKTKNLQHMYHNRFDFLADVELIYQ